MSPPDTGNPPGADDPTPAVVPRARRHGASSSIPLHQLILQFLESPVPGLLSILAPPGGGKTTAIQHLRAVLSDYPQIRFFDSCDAQDVVHAAQSATAILASETPEPSINAVAVFELSPWTIDDCLEYLAARHRSQIASVLHRLSADETLPSLKGSPALLTRVMDEMAAHPSLNSAQEALREFLTALPIPDSARDPLSALCFDRLGLLAQSLSLGGSQNLSLNTDSLGWFRHEAVQRIYLAGLLAAQLAGGSIPSCLSNMQARSLLPEIAHALPHQPASIQTLERLIAADPNHTAVPMAASILLQINPDWRPQGHWPLNLTGAVLRGARWSQMNLENSRLVDADCTGAHLSGANLWNVDAARVHMDGANLGGAQFLSAKLPEASFVGAYLSNAVFVGANLAAADFTDAILNAADFSKTNLNGAILQNATLQGALLCSACLSNVVIENADFASADLTDATLVRVDMSVATWNHARFCKARIRRCNLEGLEIVGANFMLADLTNSLLTGSRFPGANFQRATLLRTGLAEIDWENADLRDADLTHASFHLGSSRSGLVGSTIPCEGSRTGFYTDEYHEQDFKSPEEIRKASLVGADLRGAKLDDTDFYLVDLRRARYSPSQHDHFVRCGAILVSRAV